jgi:hypothetical protein
VISTLVAGQRIDLDADKRLADSKTRSLRLFWSFHFR